MVLGIERVSEKDRSFGGSDRADSQHNSLLLTKSQSEKKQHTAMSRWSRLKTMVGVKASQPFAAPVNINAKDYERSDFDILVLLFFFFNLCFAVFLRNGRHNQKKRDIHL